jgi:signal recognition particle GTPase
MIVENLKKQTLALASLLRTVAHLRSRIGWLGDANAHLFHLHARHQKRKNFIAKLTSEDRVTTSHKDKEEILLNIYENLIGSNVQWTHTNDLAALELQHHDLHMLDASISKEKVWNTIKQLLLDKAPRADGFIGKFYHSCWPIINADITRPITAV